MALTDTDRRRFVAATALTLLALPALWLANTSANSAAPNVGVAGLDAAIVSGSDVAADVVDPLDPPVAEPAPSTAPVIAAAADAAAATEVEPAPVYLVGPLVQPGASQGEIAVPAKPAIEALTAKATFRSTVGDPSTCIVPGLANDVRVTIVNVDNNRAVSCLTTLVAADGTTDVVLHTSAFASIADLTDAPISVEIRR